MIFAAREASRPGIRRDNSTSLYVVLQALLPERPSNYEDGGFKYRRIIMFCTVRKMWSGPDGGVVFLYFRNLTELFSVSALSVLSDAKTGLTQVISLDSQGRDSRTARIIYRDPAMQPWAVPGNFLRERVAAGTNVEIQVDSYRENLPNHRVSVRISSGSGSCLRRAPDSSG